MAHRRADARDRQIRAIGRPIDRWTADLEARLLGIVAAGRGGFEGVMGSVDVVLIGAVEEAAEIIEAGLRQMWTHSWLRVTRDWVAALPLGYWLNRLVPVKMLLGTEGHLEQIELLEDALDDENLFAKILSGNATEVEAREIVRVAEFGSPTTEEVDQILSATNAADGKSAMERIRTVLQKDMYYLRGAIRQSMSGEFSGASAVADLKNRTKGLLDTNEGINYKAKRIARTEGSRVAEAAQRRSWRQVGDIIKGIRAWTAGDSKVRDSHQPWHRKLYYRSGGGSTFIARDGERLPEFPAAPNCRGYTSVELIDELYAGGTKPDYGTYDAAKARNEVPDWLVRQRSKEKVS
jgi:hypothetical protein